MWKVGRSGIISCVELLVVTRRTKCYEELDR